MPHLAIRAAGALASLLLLLSTQSLSRAQVSPASSAAGRWLHASVGATATPSGGGSQAVAGVTGGAADAVADHQLPDLLTLTPTDLSLEVTAEGRHLLRFTQGLANAGSGPIRVRAVIQEGQEAATGLQEILDGEGRVVRTLPAASVIFHPHHRHWHAQDVAAYELRQESPAGPVVASNGKVSYCFVDNVPLPGYQGKKHPARFLDCTTDLMGLSPGWVDLYTADLYDQWVDVTGVADGLYYLTVTGDPHQIYVDANRENNTAWVKVELAGSGTRLHPISNGVLVRIGGEYRDEPPGARLRGDRLLVPVKLARFLGARVGWDGRQAVVRTPRARLEIQPGQDVAWLNGLPVATGGGAVVERGQLLVPARFLARALGATLVYDPESRTASITPAPGPLSPD